MLIETQNGESLINLNNVAKLDIENCPNGGAAVIAKAHLYDETGTVIGSYDNHGDCLVALGRLKNTYQRMGSEDMTIVFKMPSANKVRNEPTPGNKCRVVMTKED